MTISNYTPKFAIGEVIGEWTILNNNIPRTSNAQRSVLARCSCGTEKHVSEYSIWSGKSRSCNKCRSRGPKGLDSVGRGRDEYGDLMSSWNNYLYRYNRSASKRNLAFELTLEDFKKLCRLPCDYCGKEGSDRDFGTGKTLTKVNGIDRVDPALGYTVENCVPCCKICNPMKSDMHREDFIRHIASIYQKVGQ